jgi:nucleoside phosphorylase/DNA-binding XRE family transcriptional regulator
LISKQTEGRTVLVVTALSEERKAVISFLESVKTDQDDFSLSYVYGYFESKTLGRPWKIILPAPTRAGNVKSAAKTALSLSVRPDIIFFIGVAGGFPKKVNMYDVVVADRVYYVEPAKIDTDNSYIPRPDDHKVTAKLLSRAQSLQDIGGWQELLQPELPNEPIEVWIEPIAAGEKLVASSSSNDFARIRNAAPRAVAVENEGFGVLEAAHEAAVNALVIRGISDLLDNRPLSHRGIIGEEERAAPDPIKFKAARHAAAFMFGILSLLSDEDVGEIRSAEEEYVYVRLKWKDLHDLARGRTLAIEITEGAPVRDVVVKPGSVEVEFKTVRLFAALLYATWIEQNILSDLFKDKPDVVETLIDTSDPDVANVFFGVRLLNSPDELQRRQGAAMLSKLSSSYPVLSVFTAKITDVVNKRYIKQEMDSMSKEELAFFDPEGEYEEDQRKKARRIAIYISDDLIEGVEEFMRKRGVFRFSEAARILLVTGLDTYERRKGLDPRLEATPGAKHQRVSLTIEDGLASVLSKESDYLGIPLSKFARALLEQGVVSELSGGQKLDSMEKGRRRRYLIKNFDELRHEAGLTLSNLAKIADVSHRTISVLSAGQPVTRETASKVLNCLAKILKRELAPGQFLLES